MQDIDFGNAYKTRNTAPPYRRRKNDKNTFYSGSTKISLFIFIFLLSFALGLLSGVYLNKNKNLLEAKNIKTALKPPKDIFVVDNINSSEKNVDKFKKDKTDKHPFRIALEQQNQDSYLIWAKTYGNKRDAYQYGLLLKEKGFPVFLARSGSNFKIYIGPIKGKKKAYQFLGEVKKITPFRGAILHKKT